MTKDYLLSKTLYGVDIITHIVRLEYPDHITHIKGDDCGEAPDPVHRDGTIITIAVEKTFTPGAQLPSRCAKVHFLDGTIPDCDAIEFAMLYFQSKGTPKTEEETIATLAADLYIKEPRSIRKEPEDDKKGHEDKNVTVSHSMPPAPKMSFYRRPVKNTKPCREASPQDIFKYLISDYAKATTERCRAIKDQHELLALIAPRPLCVGSAADDLWSDPKGERLSLEAAVPVYELYGKGCSERLGYHIREGRHEIKPEDWDQYLRHADKWLK